MKKLKQMNQYWYDCLKRILSDNGYILDEVDLSNKCIVHISNKYNAARSSVSINVQKEKGKLYCHPYCFIDVNDSHLRIKQSILNTIDKDCKFTLLN